MPDRARHFPLGAALRLADLDLDPYPLFDRLRAAEPVTWAPHLDMWLVTRRDLVIAVLSDPAAFTTDSPRSTIRATFGPQMLSSDGDDQARYKRRCFPPFRAETLERELRPRIRQTAVTLLDGLDPHADLRAAFANPLAIAAISAAVGLAAEDHAVLEHCYRAFAAALANFQNDPAIAAAGQAAAGTMRVVLKDALRRAVPAPDFPLLPALRTASPDPMTESEILSNCLVILFGGIETTESAVLNAVWALLTHPDSAGADLLPGAIEESLRWESAVQSCTRHATRRAEIAGVAIERGETVQCLIGAANRDPAFFPDPHRFDPRRPNAAQHLTFGYGRHVCLGAAMARATLAEAIAALRERFPAMRLDRERSLPPRGYEFRKPPALYFHPE